MRDAKVRPDHARRESQLFQWNENLDGGHPGEDFNCRCWAEPYLVSYRTKNLQKQMVVRMAPIPQRKPEQPLRELEYTDAINPVYPIETLLGLGVSGRIISTGRAIYQLEKNVKYNLNREMKYKRGQLQSKFRHAELFGIKGNPNNKTLDQFKKALKDFTSNPETQIIKGSYHTEKVTHYYNPKTGLNVMKDSAGFYKSGPWKLNPKQIENLLRSGKLGGSK